MESLTFVEMALSIVAIILATYALIKEIYTLKRFKTPILIISERGFYFYFWILVLIMWIFNGLISHDSKKLLLYLLWIEVSVINIIRCFRGSGFYENGIYHRGIFYKWSRVRRYSWVYDNELKLNTRYIKTKIYVKNELKPKIDEELQRYVSL